jgi:hypothetical protein
VTKMVLENTASHHSVFAVGAYIDSHDWPSQPSVVFECVKGGCSLRAVRTNNGTLNYPAPHKAAREQAAVSVVSIPLTSRKGD